MTNNGHFAGNIVDIHHRRLFNGDVRWQDGVIVTIDDRGPPLADQLWLLPGLIDAHVHIESSMLTPAEFGRIACRHGTVASVSDPHEIANVLGMEGVRFMASNAEQTPFKVFLGAPSCVPATTFETAGAVIGSDDIDALLSSGDAHYLSEMMNVPGVLNDDAEVLAKLAVAHRHGVPVDGHAPGLRGSDVVRYRAAGITTDHECTTLAEAEDKLKAGIAILIREGSAARNFEALHPLISRWPEQVMFCSDDKHPDELLKGHINSMMARAVSHGHDLFDVVRCATLNPVRHYRLPTGLLRPGDRMDAVAVQNLTDFAVESTWIAGRQVASQGQSLMAPVAVSPVNQFAARPISPADLVLQAPIGEEAPQIRVIQAIDGELITPEVIRSAAVRDGQLVADVSRDILWLVVVNRYQPSPPSVAFVEGFGLRHGALASSVAHDSHNIVAVGASVDALCQAVNGVITERGGIAVAADGELSVLPLPVAGLMSDQDGDFVGAAYQALNQRALALGSPLQAPFMTLSFMALLVIPELKLSDQGLFDGRRFALTSLTLSH